MGIIRDIFYNSIDKGLKIITNEVSSSGYLLKGSNDVSSSGYLLKGSNVGSVDTQSSFFDLTATLIKHSYIDNDNKIFFTPGDFSGNKVGFENEVNKNKKMILSLLKSEDYVEGEVTKTQIYLESLHEKNPYVFSEVFQRTWLELFGKQNAYDLRKYLCISSCLDYSLLKDKADVLILGGAAHNDKYVNEAALRAAEAWGDSKLSIYLQHIREFEVDWLNDYKKSVIEYLGR